MTYPEAANLTFPLFDYKVNSYRFRQDCTFGKIHWGLHLGEDVNRPAGAAVWSIGNGEVVYSAFHPGSAKKSNWGNIVITGHTDPVNGKSFHSLYAHLSGRYVAAGERVVIGYVLGTVAQANTPENGWWPESHLHFAIYVGPWQGKVLPGYWRRDQRLTRLSWWREPTRFIRSYRGCLRIDN